MAAQSVTGTGTGACDKLTTKELAILATGPSILYSGTAESFEVASPPSGSNTVVLPKALPGAASNYVVVLTSINAGAVYITELTEEDGDFVSFTFNAESEGSVMYIVASAGIRPTVIAG